MPHTKRLNDYFESSIRSCRLTLAAGLILVLGSLSEAATINIDWEYKNFPSQIKLHELKLNAPVWNMGNVSNLDKSPVGAEITPARLKLEPGRRKLFALVAHNPTDKTIHFFAAPHAALPAEHSLGFKFQCLCINHAFEIKPKHYWYRVVEIRLARGFAAKTLNVSHNVVGISKDFAESINSQP
jgi:hypothetical protein